MTVTTTQIPVDSIWYHKGVRWRVVHIADEHAKLETCHKTGDKPAGKLEVKVKTLLNRYQRLS